MKEYDHIEFRQGLPFYNMVMSFMTSLSAVSLIYNNERLIDLKEKDWVSISGRWVEPRHFFPHDVISNIKSGKFDLQVYINSCCCMLTNSAFESVKQLNDKSPEFELFRHLRNASSHQNLFNFFEKEPTLPASWQSAVIDHSYQGKANPLYGTSCFGNFIGVPDLIDLLKEIEGKIS